jgi:ferritin-like metal-binding protein YciE
VAKLTDPRVLLAHDLAAMLQAEKSIGRTLPRMHKKVSDAALAKGLERHADETKQQVANLQQAIKELGVRGVKGSRAAGADALAQEFKESSTSVADQLVDIVSLGVNSRIEHYEIAAYESMISMARALGERKVVQLLTENLKQEKQMLREGMDISKRLGKQAVGAA